MNHDELREHLARRQARLAIVRKLKAQRQAKRDADFNEQMAAIDEALADDGFIYGIDY